MLRLGFFAYAKPLFGPTATRSGPHLFPLPLRSFSSAARPRITETLRNRPLNFVTRPFQQSSRGIVDSAVISRPSQTEAWRRYAVTAATVAGTIVAVEVFFEQGYARQPYCG